MEAQTYATDIIKKLVRAGYIAYFAGGWVRDYLMGNVSDDIDIATNAPPEKILDLFPRTILVGLAFGIVIVVVNGHQYEVATFRRDINYEGGRRPTHIEYSTPEEDALRRDFTINGMFYDPLEDVIHDFVHGKSDVQAHIIRAIGDPYERFFEDRLRMVRAIRFASRLGFVIDLDTQEAIRENANLLFPSVAMERLWQEFYKMSKYPHFENAFIEMHRLGLLPVIFPSLENTHLNDIKARVSAFPHYPKNCPTILYLIALFPEASLKEALDLCEYLKISAQDARLIELFYKTKELMGQEFLDKREWVLFLANPYSQLCIDVFSTRFPHEEREAMLGRIKSKKEYLNAHIERVSQKKPLINASFLHLQGIPSGKLMGALLKEAEKIVITHNLSDPEDALKLLKETPIWPK